LTAHELDLSFPATNVCAMGQCSDAVKGWCGGGVFSNHFITNFPQNVSVKKLKLNRSIFGHDMDKSLRLTFWATLYM